MERIYRKFRAKGENIVLRPMSRTDVEGLLVFINQLVDDKKQGKDLKVFTGFERRVTRREEARWLVSQIVRIEKGDLVSVLAEIDGRIVANGGVERGHYAETQHHGRIGLTVLSAFRGVGIGREIVEVLVQEARRRGLRNLEVEFLSDNRAAIRTYKKAGFAKVGRMPGKVHRNGNFFDSMIMARNV